MSPGDSLARETAAPRRWLSIVGIGEDGRRRTDRRRARSCQGRGDRVRRQAASRARRIAHPRRGAALAQPIRARGRGGAGLSGAAGLRSRLGRSVLLWRRGGAAAARRPARNLGGAGAVDIQPGRRAPRLGAAGGDGALAPWPVARSRPAASPAGRTGAGADVRRRGTGRACAAACRNRLRRFAHDRARSAGRSRRTPTRDDGAADFDLGDVGALNAVAIEVEAAPGARVLARVAGLSDELFEHDGQITKREIRAITLSALGPRRGELLWDVGAGAGSVAIEWMLADPSMRAVALEARGDRAARIRRNAAAFGVPALEVVEGRAPAAFDGLAAAGCGLRRRRRQSMPVCSTLPMDALRPGGRLVVNAVTLETEASCWLAAPGLAVEGSAASSSASRCRARSRSGAWTAWRPAMPVTQWIWIKP